MESLVNAICDRRGWRQWDFDALPAEERDGLLAREYQRRVTRQERIESAFKTAKRRDTKGKSYTSTEVLNTLLLLALLETD